MDVGRKGLASSRATGSVRVAHLRGGKGKVKVELNCRYGEVELAVGLGSVR